MSESGSNAPRQDARRPWSQPTLTPIGTVSAVVAGGTGKLSTSGGDPGEGRKQKTG